jgi:hypothetical protein
MTTVIAHALSPPILILLLPLLFIHPLLPFRRQMRDMTLSFEMYQHSATEQNYIRFAAIAMASIWILHCVYWINHSPAVM